MKNKRFLAITLIVGLVSDSPAQSTFTKVTNGPFGADIGTHTRCVWGDFSNGGWD